MADVCPIPEERAMIIGVTVSLVYAMDSWMNRGSQNKHNTQSS